MSELDFGDYISEIIENYGYGYKLFITRAYLSLIHDLGSKNFFSENKILNYIILFLFSPLLILFMLLFLILDIILLIPSNLYGIYYKIKYPHH